MHAAHAGKSLELLHHLDRDRDALCLRVARRLQAIEDLGDERETGDLAETLRLLQRAEDENAREDRHIARSAATHLDEPTAERRKVEDRLRLEEFGARGDLVVRLSEVRLNRLGER